MDRPVCCGRAMVKHGLAGSGRQRWRCNECERRSTNGGDAECGYDAQLAADHFAHIKQRIQDGCKRFVITSAQNNTAVNTNFLQSLMAYCKHNKAELIIIPTSYKNISLYTASQEYKKRWDAELEPFFIDRELYLGGNVSIRADIHIGATTLHPLAGKEPIGGSKWAIFGHPQFAMEPVASVDTMPKRMYTTGSVTRKSYSKTNAGAKAEFHHVTGALIVEVVNGKRAFVRQLNADYRGEFYDLDKLYTPGGVQEGAPALAIVPGDEHVKFNDPSVREATYGPNGLVATLKPEYIFRHDVLDGYAGSHHHEHDDVIQFRKFHKGDHDYRKELDQAVKFINETTPEFSHTLIVKSNHDEHLAKWLRRTDPKKDPQNALLIMELKHQQYTNALEDLTTDPMEIYVTPRLTCKFTFLDRHDHKIIKGVNYSQHGDQGINGSRGSARGFAKTAQKMVIGHSHSARIVRGVYQVGSSTGRLEYYGGLSEATNTHCIQYANGKRTLIDIIDGQWRLNDD